MITRVLKFLTPFRVLLGIGAMCIGLLFFVSLFLGVLDNLLNSECGFSCGFVATEKTLFNPLDDLLIVFSDYFPLDYLVFGVIVLYIFLASLYGIVKWGIRLLCIQIFRI